MSELLISVLRPVILAGVGFLLILIHELGHYAVGRWLIGIPASDLKVVITEFPAHVALRDGQTWVSPIENQYHKLYRQYDPGHYQSVAYISGGLIAQTIGAVGIGGVLLAVDIPEGAEAFVVLSIFLTVFNLIWESAHIIRRRDTGGDFWGLWNTSPIATIAVLIMFVVPHAALYLAM